MIYKAPTPIKNQESDGQTSCIVCAMHMHHVVKMSHRQNTSDHHDTETPLGTPMGCCGCCPSDAPGCAVAVTLKGLMHGGLYDAT